MMLGWVVLGFALTNAAKIYPPPHGLAYRTVFFARDRWPGPAR